MLSKTLEFMDLAAILMREYFTHPSAVVVHEYIWLFSTAAPAKYTLVPWEEVDPAKHPEEKEGIKEPRIPRDDYNFGDRNLFDSTVDVFNEGSELRMTNPRSNAPRHTVNFSGQGVRQRRGTGGNMEETYEMRPSMPHSNSSGL